MEYNILNVGCGDDFYGTHRIDIIKTPASNKVYDVNKGLPYPSYFFNEVYVKNILEHIKNLDIFSKECYRVLKKNGKIYVRTDNAGYLPFHVFKTHEHNAFLQHNYAVHSYKHSTNIDNHVHLFVPSHLKVIFKDFKNVSINYIYLSGRNKLNKVLLRLLPFNLGAMQIELRGIK